MYVSSRSRHVHTLFWLIRLYFNCTSVFLVDDLTILKPGTRYFIQLEITRTLLVSYTKFIYITDKRGRFVTSCYTF